MSATSFSRGDNQRDKNHKKLGLASWWLAKSFELGFLKCLFHFIRVVDKRFIEIEEYDVICSVPSL
jgi:hypothetical protein